MFFKPLYENLAIINIALAILLMTFLHSPLVWVLGSCLIILSGFILYKHYIESGTNPDVLGFKLNTTES